MTDEIKNVKDDTDNVQDDKELDEKKEEEKKEDDGKGEADTKDKDGKADESEDEGAPDTYEDFTLPEGMEVDKELATEFKELAKNRNWSQKEAQEVVDLQTKAMIRAGEIMTERWASTQKEWRESTENDKEYGRKNLDDTLVFAKEAIKSFGNDAFSEVMESTGMGNHPEMLRFLWKVGKSVSEDDILKGGTDTGTPKDLASRIYPNMK